MSLPGRPADPLEWHPWYRDRTYLLDWLTTGRYNGRQQDDLGRQIAADSWISYEDGWA